MATFPHLFLSYPDTGGGYSFTNTEASDIVAAMVSAPDDTRKALIDTLVGALKTAGVWAKLDALYVFAAHTSQAGLLNWIAPSGTAATATNSPVFTTDRGFAGNGTSSYIDTGFIPSSATQLTLNSMSASVWSLTSGQTSPSGFGVIDGSSRGITLVCRNTSNQLGIRTNNNTVNYFNGVTNGVGCFTAMRTGVSTVNGYRNGVSLGSGSPATTGLPNQSVYVGAINSNGVAGSFVNRQFAMTAFGAGRTGTEETDFYNAVQAYMTALGA